MPWGKWFSHLGDNGKGSLRWAVENANEGEIITFAPEIFSRTIVLNSPIQVPVKSISLKGPNRHIIISAPYSGIFSNISSAQFSITGISFRDAYSILQSNSKGSINIDNCSFRNIQTCFPWIEGELEIKNSSFYKNKDILPKGGERVSFSKCNIESNKGIIFSGERFQELILDHCHLESNHAPPSKGLFCLKANAMHATHCQVNNCKFIGNVMPKGAIFHSKFQGGKNHKIDIKENTIRNNKGKIIFAILDKDAVLTLNQGNTNQGISPCNDEHPISRSGTSIYLGTEVFPNFCEGGAILRRSSESRFVNIVGGKIQRNQEHINCCEGRIKIF